MNMEKIFERPDPFAGKPRYVRVKVALQLLDCSKTKLYRLVAEGRITAVRLDGSSYIDLESVRALFEACPKVRPKPKDEPMSPETLRALGFDVAPNDPGLAFTITEDDLGLPADPGDTAVSNG